MARIYAYAGIRPVEHASAFVHPEAELIGDVIIGEGVFVGPGASLRGDMGRLVVERGANVQDNCVMHGFPGKDCVIEEDGHIGHGAILHGCRIGKNALVGMNAVVMDGAVIGENAFVGAMSLVKAGFEVPPGMLAIGMPARIARPLTADEIAWKTTGTQVYQELARRAQTTLVPCQPLAEPEPGRPSCPIHGDVRPLGETRRG